VIIRGNKAPVAFFLLILATLLFLPALLEDKEIYHRVMAMSFFYAALAFAWNLYALTGCISLGHAAFFGLGAYGSALTQHYTHFSPYLTILCGGLTGTLYGVAWVLTFKRLRGAPLALATLASVEIPKVIIDNWDSFTFGSLGLVGISSLPALQIKNVVIAVGENLRAQYYLLLFFMLVIAGIHNVILTSRLGWAIRAAREDEEAASMLGVNAAGIRSCALILSAFLTSLCGGLYAHLIGLVEPGLVFSLHISALPLVLTIFGGRYSCYGPLLGALILYPLDQLLLHSLVPVGHAIIYGLVIILALLFFPSGVGAWLQQRL
jgi:branched-chain amino acid transport system permease protein